MIITLVGFEHWFGWNQNKVDNFIIESPNTWKYESNLKGYGGNGNESWYTEKTSIGAGKCTITKTGKCMDEYLMVFIYSPSDKSFEESSAELKRYSYEEFSPIKRANIKLAGMDSKELFNGSNIWAGPIEHRGQLYYFSGSKTTSVKRMLSSFQFTD